MAIELHSKRVEKMAIELHSKRVEKINLKIKVEELEVLICILGFKLHSERVEKMVKLRAKRVKKSPVMGAAISKLVFPAPGSSYSVLSCPVNFIKGFDNREIPVILYSANGSPIRL